VSARSLRLAACIGSLLVAGTAAAETPSPLDARRVADALPGTDARQITPVPLAGGLFEIIDAEGNVLYMDGAGRIAFEAQLVELATRRNLTQESVTRFKAVAFDSLPLDLAIKRVKGSGARRLAVFADPDCPYCSRLEQELEGVDDVTVYTFLHPIPELHPDAVERSRRIWCADDRDAAWRGWLLDQREAPAAPEGCESPATKIDEIAPRFWINGTPSLVFGSGRVVNGALPRAAIETYLVEPPLAAAAAAAASPATASQAGASGGS
jgi:thiol:disulfide interchange protein DsbC